MNAQGKALSDRGDYQAAIPVLERAVRAFPSGTTAASDLNYAFTLFNLGHALNAGGRPADAVPVLEERLKNPEPERHRAGRARRRPQRGRSMTVTSLADRYRVLGRLGAGGMAVVMLAEDERLGRKVAVKRLRSESPDDAAKRFEREAKLGASLNHPNIVAVYDIVTDDEGVLIVMEYVEGHTLRLEMDSGPMPPARAIEVLSGVAAGLDHAHEHGVVHRDVKPANVLIAERDGTVKLADLGIATAAERTHITHSGVVLGTAAYLAPERLDGNAGGPAADVYATAAVAFEMLSGRRAVTGNSAVEIARRVMEAPAPDLSEVLPGAPKAAADVLKRGLAKDPHERQVTAGQLVRELSAAYAAIDGRRAPAGGRRSARAARPEADARAAAGRRLRPRGGARGRRRARDRPPRRRFQRQAAGPGRQAAAARRPTAPGRKHAPKPAHSEPQPAPPPAPPAQRPNRQPGTALTSFYTRAANHDFTGAWAMGTDNLHSQFGSLATFRSTLATLQSIAFPTMRVTSQTGTTATVEFSSVAKHPDRTDHCTGQASLVKQGSSWLVDHIVTSGTPPGRGQEKVKSAPKR